MFAACTIAVLVLFVCLLVVTLSKPSTPPPALRVGRLTAADKERLRKLAELSAARRARQSPKR